MSNIKERIVNDQIEIDGVSFDVSHEEIQVGDSYLAERNRGPVLLTAKEIIPLNVDGSGGWIVPVESAYCYDIHECIKVKGIK